MGYNYIIFIGLVSLKKLNKNVSIVILLKSIELRESS